MSDALRLILSTRPSWATFIASPSMDLWFDVTTPPHNGMPVGGVRLRIFGAGAGAAVVERTPDRRYPQYCPERHIVGGSAFCLGLELRPVRSPAEGEAWWSDLHHFLVLQAVAEQTGRWPVPHALSHGKAAAEYELEARRLARRLEIENDYDRMLDGERNWITELVAGTGKARNRRIGALVALEKKRRAAVENFWCAQFDKGYRCCGSMKRCRLRELEAGVATADAGDNKGARTVRDPR